MYFYFTRGFRRIKANIMGKSETAILSACTAEIYGIQGTSNKSRFVEFSDCRQACYLAFLDALEDYNRKPQTVKFTTFAAYHVKNHVNTLLGLRTKKNEPLNICRSLDEPLPGQDSEEITLLDTIKDIEAQEPFSDVEQSDVYRVVREAVEDLPEQNKAVIESFYFKGITLKETAAQMNVSTEYVRQIKTKSLNMLRRHKKLDTLYREFYYRPSGYRSFSRFEGSCVENYVEQRLEWLEELEKIRAYLVSIGYSEAEALRITTPRTT